MPLKPVNTKARLENLKKWPYHAFFIAKDTIKGRWPAAEPYIKDDARYAYFYAKDIIKGRWPEAEPVIMNSKWAKDYLDLFPRPNRE
jgi:hypothetical protein